MYWVVVTCQGTLGCAIALIEGASANFQFQLALFHTRHTNTGMIMFAKTGMSSLTPIPLLKREKGIEREGGGPNSIDSKQ